VKEWIKKGVMGDSSPYNLPKAIATGPLFA